MIIIGVFALRQAIPHFEKLVSAAGSSVEIYKIIDEVRIIQGLLIKFEHHLAILYLH